MSNVVKISRVRWLLKIGNVRCHSCGDRVPAGEYRQHLKDHREVREAVEGPPRLNVSR